MSHPQQPYSQQPPPQGGVYGQPPAPPPWPAKTPPKKKGNALVGCLALVVIALIGVVIVLIAVLPNASEDEPAAPPPASNDLAGYLAALAAVDPALADVSENTARNSADNICQELADGKESAVVARNAALRFGVDEQLGAPIVAATQEHVC